MKVLLVTDSHELTGFVGTLRTFGHEVYQAVNTEDASEKIEQGAFDLLLLDSVIPYNSQRAPEMEPGPSLVVAKRFRATNPEAKMIMQSLADLHWAEAFEAQGVDMRFTTKTAIWSDIEKMILAELSQQAGASAAADNDPLQKPYRPLVADIRTDTMYEVPRGSDPDKRWSNLYAKPRNPYNGFGEKN
jgi:DNA-binding NtrC family response regulator